MEIDVSVIIAHRNDSHLQKTIGDLLLQTTNVNFEIIVVDDNSDEGYTPRYSWPYSGRVRVFPLSKQGGCGNARNYGRQFARGRILAFIDSDLDLNPYWISNAYMNVKLGLLVTGPVPKKFRNDKPTLAERYNAIESPHSHGERTYGTGNTAMMKADFDRVGGFNKDIVRGHDMDFFSRWDGEVLVTGGLRAWHPAKNHREKVKTIKEIVRDWKKLGHRPNFVRRLAPDRTLLGNIRKADVSITEKAKYIAYHFYLKGVYLWYWVF